MVGQIAGHQRREPAAPPASGEDATAIGLAGATVVTGGTRIGHDDRARELPRGMGATAFSISPSRKWTCQSSGRRSAFRSEAG